jgi:heterodisulfide reductase subunit C
MTKEKTTTTLETQFSQELNKRGLNLKPITIPNLIRSMQKKFAEIGESVLENGKENDIDLSKNIEKAEKTFTQNQIEEARAKFEKQFQTSQELHSKKTSSIL